MNEVDQGFIDGTEQGAQLFSFKALVSSDLIVL